ncbi:succinate dehydrogenase/fumarate reductase cytochrome b subunit [Corallococcus interemptor]|uniref:Succinate dehydrogenase/fumarate reductase cytochrome b subunit n=1 Tax=Corallococcus interemptor TaxID=2316720 RepID=A0A3A8QS83_9BACT|nr:succinate dehydrogenase cytochrome b subunit [Corallococcus interemptor]RKH71639.1 succinate dehydrogenase/fumarate reductase cytochrome b subunit [Corallococcus interemptor]
MAALENALADDDASAAPLDSARAAPHRGHWGTTVGMKILMAATGVVLVVFLVFHLAGNLLVYQGAGALNAYSALLRREPLLLWLARAVLLFAVCVHIAAAARLGWRDFQARPVRYRQLVPQSATLASRTMRWSGLGIATFVVFHLLHLTTGTIRPAPFEEVDVYRNVVGGFRVGWVAIVYLVAMVLIGMHVWHGAWASLRSLGVSRPSLHPKRRPVAWVLALLLWAGFTSIPIAVLLGVVR